MLIVELEAGVWVADWDDGDPPRTLNICQARKFKTMKEAVIALMSAREFHPFENAQIIDDMEDL